MGRHIPSALSARTHTGTWLWLALCLTLAVPAWWLAPVSLTQPVTTWHPLAQTLVMHPDMGLHQSAWVWWTSAWLHGSQLHLTHNLIALGLIAMMGMLCRVSALSAAIWCLVWPLTQLGMVIQAPPLQSYIGLSGVLHGGVAVMAMQQIVDTQSTYLKPIAWVLAVGLLIKIIMENPWSHTITHPNGSDIAVATWGHLTGYVSATTLYLIVAASAQLICLARQATSRRTLNRAPPRKPPGT
ncbi:MAG: rhomboid family intramembrane serine protease [Aquabacterium sp.]|nr:rhomboid family intramembrane serine protease [Aquabacterium sp.]